GVGPERGTPPSVRRRRLRRRGVHGVGAVPPAAGGSVRGRVPSAQAWRCGHLLFLEPNVLRQGHQGLDQPDGQGTSTPRVELLQCCGWIRTAGGRRARSF
ncbi:unnamed protein product, partial [Ectocarpus fasciculatus]